MQKDLDIFALGHAKGIYSKLLFDGEVSSLVRAIKKDAMVRDLQGSELMVEFVRNLNKKERIKASLSELECTFRNNEIDICVEFDDRLGKVIRAWPNDTEISVQENEIPTTNSKMVIDQSQTMGELKRKMLEKLYLHCLSHLEKSNGVNDVDSDMEKCVDGLMQQVRMQLNPDLAGKYY